MLLITMVGLPCVPHLRHPPIMLLVLSFVLLQLIVAHLALVAHSRVRIHIVVAPNCHSSSSSY